MKKVIYVFPWCLDKDTPCEKCKDWICEYRIEKDQTRNEDEVKFYEIF